MKPNIVIVTFLSIHIARNHIPRNLDARSQTSHKRNDMSTIFVTTFLEQILSDRLLLIVIVRAKK